MEASEAQRTLDAELERGRDLFAAAGTLEELERAQISVLGRKATLGEVQRALGSMPEADRREVGRRANEVRAALQAALDEHREGLRREERRAQLERDRVDVTLPGRRPRPGSLHPMTATENEIVEVFTRLGYRVVEGPEVENEYYNFTALNIPEDHPARGERDTIYVDLPGRSDLLLRTETSAMQIRTMERQEPPVYIVAPGRVFRQDTPDPTHMPVFHQVEGLAIDEGLSMTDLRGTLAEFARAMFGEHVDTRFTPDYFPFVEPGAQLEVTCFVCNGMGCRTCKESGWIELLGCGMVHPAVLENLGYDSERYTGFAFGLGIERVAMPRYGIPDMRLLYSGDVRFLEQFPVES
jgi:phenylalanyl-tRNA synthetase alpha chain